MVTKTLSVREAAANLLERLEEAQVFPHWAERRELREALDRKPDDAPRPHDVGFAEGGGPLTFRDLQRTNRSRVPKFGHTLEEWSPMEWACAAAGEMGELCNALKKQARQEDPARPGYDVSGKKRPTMRDVADEIADVVIYLDLLASKLGIDMQEAVRGKWNEVSARLGWTERV